MFFYSILYTLHFLLLNIFFRHSKIFWVATYSYSIPNTLLFLQLINISFLTLILFFILSFFQSKKKKSSPFLEQVKSFSQWFGINAIFHKNAIENRVSTDLAALDDARTRSFCFAIDSTNHWQRNGLDTVSRGVIHDAKAQFLRPGDDE